MQEFTVREQEEKDRAKEQERLLDEQRRLQAIQQVEQQRMYKAELQNSYKSILDNQLNQNKMMKDIENSEKANQARIA